MKKRIQAIAVGVVALIVTSSSYAADNTSSKSGKAHVVHSVIDGHQTMTAYNKRGKWIYTIQNYTLDNLNKNIIDRVNPVYYNYGVTGIQKVEQPGQDVVYVIQLENAKSIKIVRLTDDEVELVHDFIKG